MRNLLLILIFLSSPLAAQRSLSAPLAQSDGSLCQVPSNPSGEPLCPDGSVSIEREVRCRNLWLRMVREATQQACDAQRAAGISLEAGGLSLSGYLDVQASLGLAKADSVSSADAIYQRCVCVEGGPWTRPTLSLKPGPVDFGPVLPSLPVNPDIHAPLDLHLALDLASRGYTWPQVEELLSRPAPR